jgi:hypothetical protein
VVLRAALKGSPSGVPLSAAEDGILRAAFGRYDGRMEARAAAAPIVRHYQQLGPGQWLLCDCLRAAAYPPVLVPVSQTHIRRHEHAPWPPHLETCDFFREPAEQREITASYRAGTTPVLRLVRAFDVVGPVPTREGVTSSHHRRRPGLARLLTRLMTEAGLQEIGAGCRPAPLNEQVAALWRAARAIEIDRGIGLPAFLRTSPARLGELVQLIEGAGGERFQRTRPHGVLIARVAAIGAGVLRPVVGEPIPVRGRLAVFGERAGGGRDTAEERAARAPYLAVCSVARPAADEPVQVLAAYAHPCVSASHLMLVDSDLERRTLMQLRSVQDWLLRKRGIAVTIVKPLFDLGPAEDAADGGSSRPPCMPDFIVRARGVGEAGAPEVIVETMGFADEDYRARKCRVHPAMAAALGGAPVVQHDFHLPEGRAQSWRDERFWRDLRWTLTGGEVAQGGTAGGRMNDRAIGSPVSSGSIIAQ